MKRSRWTTADRELVQRFESLGRAYRLQFAVRWSFRALIAGIAVDALLLGAEKLGLASNNAAGIIVVGPLAITVLALVGSALVRHNDAAIALSADRELGLRERLTTAVELRAGAEGSLAAIQAADTLRELRAVRPSQAFPIRLSRHEAIGLALVFLGVFATVLVPARAAPARDEARLGETIRREAERLTALADATSEQQVGEAAPLAAAALRDAGKGLEKSNGSPERAVAALAQASQQLAGISSASGANLREALSRAAAGLRSEAATRQAVDGAQVSGDETASALRDLANSVGGMTADQRSAASRALQEAASGASSFDPRLAASLRQAASATAAGGPEAARALERAADQATQASQAIARQNVVDQARAQIDQSRSAISAAARQSTAERGTSGAGSDSRATPSSRGEAAGGQQNGDSSDGEDSGEQGSGAGKGSVENSTQLFDPNSGTSHLEQVDSADFENPTTRSSDKTGIPEAGSALTDYRDVYAGYRDRATAATQDRYIPLDLKDLVRDYFASLDPD